MAINSCLLFGPYLAQSNDATKDHDPLIDYYEKAGPDYEEWSPNFNMHFGYYQKGMNPFNREQMLQNMNDVVLKLLKIDPTSSATLVDMGCGLGATMRYATSTYPDLTCKGVTLVPWQKQQADQLNTMSSKFRNIEILIEDYKKTSIPANSVDHVIAIESGCYAEEVNKAPLLREIHRILKPGGSFVMADGFLRTNKPLKGILRLAYRQLCRSWALSELGVVGEINKELEVLNFKDIEMQDISWRVAPSVAHVPFTVIQFLMKQMLFSKVPMTKERWDNLKSPLLTMVLGLHQSQFGYYLISGVKNQDIFF
ncbi:MAG: class I SAM-dependent methyltransferase [Cytophagales bacterium]|nr:class I SAM-dependent methyltransferase [Cytophagales bacterium]